MLIQETEAHKLYMNALREKHLKNKMIGQYLLREKIGKGGFAEVFKGRHIQTGEYVAIKIIKKNTLQASDLERTRNQIQIQSKLFHSNIVPIYQVIQTSNKIFIIMEYVPKGQLYETIVKNGKLTEKLAAKIFVQILSALIYLHEQGIAHRDIKTENIILDNQMNAKLIDFGLAQKYQPFDMLKTICGSPCYLAPQMVLKQKYKPQLVDVWCLGVTLYIMVCQKYPFYGKNHDAMKDSILKYKYLQQPTLSNDLKELFQRIFLSPSNRITLKQMMETNFAKKAPKLTINSVNITKENIYIDESLVNEIQSNYKIPKFEVIHSVSTFKLDQKSALYYLMMKKNRDKGLVSQSDLTSTYFRKDKKSFLIKPYNNKRKSECKVYQNDEKQFINSLSTSKKQSKTKIIQATIFLNSKNKDFHIRTRKLPRVSIEKSRLRKLDQSPESPKRILDRVEAYHISEYQTQQ